MAAILAVGQAGNSGRQLKSEECVSAMYQVCVVQLIG